MAVAAATTLVVVGSAQASTEQTESFRPVETTARSLMFNLRGVDPDAVVDAQAVLRGKRGRSHRVERERSVSLSRVRSAASRQRQLRVRKPRFVRSGKLSIELGEDPASAAGSGTCTPDPAALTAAGCPVDFQDTGSGSAEAIWGSIDCQTASRSQTLGGGDPDPTALGVAQDNDQFRRMTVYDGDDFWGERCELGHNDNRTGPTAVYHEGDHKVTFASLRLPSNLPLDTNQWQVVLQMKQAQPAANGSGTPVLSLDAYNGGWAMLQSNSTGTSYDSHQIWSAPAAPEQWTRFAFDVHYSRDPSQGSISIYVDLNGDGDAADTGEQSAPINTYTLKTETAGGGDDPIAPGESIPSHLRAGIYHSPTIDCPRGCSVDVDNVQVVDLG